MVPDIPSGGLIRFGVWELDPYKGELRKAGVRLKLRPQALRVLALLASRPGETVSREEIQKQIWNDGTNVDFERGLNFCIRQIRTVLNDDADTPRFIETVPRRGYRFLAPLSGNGSEPLTATATVPRRRLLAGVVIAAAATLAAALSWWFIGRAGHGARMTSLAVLPFVNIGHDPDNDYYADGLAGELIQRLAKEPALRVTSQTSSFAFKGKAYSVHELAAQLHIEGVVEGEIRKTGDRLVLNIRLIDVAGDRPRWSETYRPLLKDAFVTLDDITRGIIQSSGIRPTSQIPASRRPQTSEEVYDLYLKGRYLLRVRGRAPSEKAADLFQRAVARDPGFAAAWAGLATAYGILDFAEPVAPFGHQRQRDAALKALGLDDKLGEAHFAMAEYRVAMWDWRGADQECRRALELNPSDAEAYAWYAAYLSLLGRRDEAIECARRANQLDPVSVSVGGRTSLALLYVRDYDRTIEQGRRVLELDSNVMWALDALGRAYLQKGMCKEAIGVLQRRDNTSTGFGQGPLAYAYSRCGEKAKALEILALARKAYVPGPFQARNIARIYAGLGDKEKALEWLEKDFETKHHTLPFAIAVWPEFDMLRAQPRFQDLVKRTGLADMP